ncbi:MAG: glycosyltransferase [Endomicrobiia bacterium]|nr:glycosyltransferase [Endomicrobiaceae bacterium]MDD3053866.1 glycosyltransferase [Endomicrobiaceae bacterium]MDD3923064.1 glycosyltransferase [Endomicrobiaceae bacterium]
MNKIKVLHMFSSFTIGGAEKMTLLISISFDKLSNEIEPIVAAPKNSFLYRQAEENNVKVCDFNCRGSFTPTGVIKLIQIIKKEEIKILHVHQGKLFWTALLMKLFFKNIKVVLHRRQDTRHKFYAKWHYKIADMTLTVSKAVRDNLIKYEKVTPNKVRVLYNGFDFSRFSKEIYCDDIITKYNLNNKTVIGTIAAIVSFEGKGQVYLMEAIAKLRTNYPDLRCLLVGDGAGKKEQEEYAKKLKIDDIVFFVGYQADVTRYLKVMDIFCLLSCGTEGFGNVNLEAQSLAIPVITTQVGGNPETVIDNKTGFVIEPRNVEKLIIAIKKLLDNKDYARKVGIEGQKFVKATFSIEKMVENLTIVYKDILK